MANAPQAIWDLWYRILAEYKPSGARPLLAGIVGDVNHSFGFHLSYNDLHSRGEASTDYSLQTARDKAGARANPNDASALDVSFSPPDMITVTKRLIAAAEANDPRLHCLFEFCGTTNGTSPHPYTVDTKTNDPNNTQGWDASHVTHVHVSIHRDVCNDFAAIKGVADVIAGIPLAYPPTSPNWSDTVDKAEIQQMINDTAIASQRASLLGEESGEFTHAKHPRIVPADAAHGVLDRLAALEAK